MIYLPPEWLTRSPHRPPDDEIGDRLPDPLYSAVGRLTNRWEGVEINLMALWMRCVQSPHVGGFRSFGAIVGSGARCDMIQAALDGGGPQYFPDPWAKQAMSFLNVARRLSGLRNIVAHGVVARLEGDFFKVYQAPTKPGSYFVTPAAYNTAKTGNKGSPRMWYASATVERVSEAMSELSGAIMDFVSVGGATGIVPPSTEGWNLIIRRGL